MVPGITDTECQIWGLRYQELLAEGDQRRRAASVAPNPANPSGVIESIGRHLGALMAQCSHLLHNIRTQQGPSPTAASGTVAVN